MNKETIIMVIVSIGWHACSCDSSICRAHSVLRTICNTIDYTIAEWDGLNSIRTRLRHLHRFYEQHGSLQFRTHAQLPSHQLSSSQVPRVHRVVSLSFIPPLFLILFNFFEFYSQLILLGLGLCRI